MHVVEHGLGKNTRIEPAILTLINDRGYGAWGSVAPRAAGAL